MFQNTKMFSPEIYYMKISNMKKQSMVAMYCLYSKHLHIDVVLVFMLNYLISCT